MASFPVFLFVFLPNSAFFSAFHLGGHRLIPPRSVLVMNDL